MLLTREFWSAFWKRVKTWWCGDYLRVPVVSYTNAAGKTEIIRPERWRMFKAIFGIHS
jgi:hypothetical protein